MNKYLSTPEWLSFLLIGFSSVASILPAVVYLQNGSFPDYWLSESGIYETAGAAAIFIAGLLSLESLRLLSKQKQHLRSFWMLLFAVVCLFIAGEEVSWGQHIFDYEMAGSIASTNFQKEFNVHNSMLIQSSNNQLSSLFFKLLMFYLILLPMLLVVFPEIEKLVQRTMIPVPGMLIAVVALLAKAADIVNHKIVYGTSFEKDSLHLGEVVESMFELCLLILAIECFHGARRKSAWANDKRTPPGG